MNYWQAREYLASDLRNGLCPKTAEAMVDHIATCGNVNVAESAEYVARFFNDINRDIARRTSQKAK